MDEIIKKYMIKLSIVILTYNRKEKVSRCIESCLSNRISCQYEIIVIDNHSNDGTKELIESKYLQFVKYIYMDENLGSPRGRNNGFNITEGEYVLFLDDDIYFENCGDIDRLLKTKIENEDIAIISTVIFDTLENEFIPYIESRHYKSGNLVDVLSYHGAIHIVRRSDFKKNLYSSKVKFGFEETMLSIDTVNRGFRVAYTKEIAVMHDGPRFEYTRERQAVSLKTLLYTKKSLYPNVLFPVIIILHYLRCIKYFGFDLKQIKKITKIDIEINPEDRITFKTIYKLLRNYNFTQIF